MFRLLPETYFWPIVAHVAENGQIVEKTLFEAEFKRLSQKDADDLNAKDLRGFVLSFVCGWRNCNDLDGKEIPFSEENLVSLLEDNATLEAVILDAYAESVKLVKRKN
jgi:hypothetical protein